MFHFYDRKEELRFKITFVLFSVVSVGKCLGQWEHVHGSRGDYLVSLPQLCRLQTAWETPRVVRRKAVSKRQKDRRGHIPGRGKIFCVILSLHRYWLSLHSGKKNQVASTPGGRDFMDEIDLLKSVLCKTCPVHTYLILIFVTSNPK